MEQSYVMVQCLHIRNIQDLRRYKTYFELFKVRNDKEMLGLPYSPHHRKVSKHDHFTEELQNCSQKRKNNAITL